MKSYHIIDKLEVGIDEAGGCLFRRVYVEQ